MFLRVLLPEIPGATHRGDVRIKVMKFLECWLVGRTFTASVPNPYKKHCPEVEMSGIMSGALDVSSRCIALRSACRNLLNLMTKVYQT